MHKYLFLQIFQSHFCIFLEHHGKEEKATVFHYHCIFGERPPFPPVMTPVTRETLRAAEHWWQHTVRDKRLGRTGKAVWKGSADP